MSSSGARAITRRGALGALGATALGLPVSCIPEGRLKRPFEMKPQKREGDWQVATPEAVGLEPDSVEAAYRRVFDPNKLPNIRSMLVARRGLLVAEGYIADADDIDREGALMSATKSVTALLAGIAMERGDIESLDTTLADVLVEAEAGTRKGSITLRNLLEMRSGIAYSNDDFSIDMEWGGIENSVRYILSKRLKYEPGTVFDYTDACAHLCGALIQQATSETLHDLAKASVFEAAGIRRSTWLAHSDGRSFGAYGLFLTPRDFLRLGQETLRSYNTSSGSVPQDWVLDCTTEKVKHDFDNDFKYGYYWWLAPDGTGFTPEGHGGQVCFVDPDLELLVAITADPNSSYDGVAVELSDVLSLVRQIRKGAGD